MALRIFISHSHKDAAWCDRFVEQLATYDLDLWYDRQGLYAGSQWLRTIEDELTSRDLFLVVLTPESWASDWVREELALALAAKKRIIGVLQQQTHVTGFLLQRQMLSVVGQSAATAAQTVAASLGVQAKAQADLRTEQPQAPFPPSATLQTPSLTGEWTEAVGLEARWMFAITQNGQILTGTWAVDSPPASGHTDARPITGHVSEEEITIEFDLSGGAHYILRLRLVEGKLVGTKWTSIYGGQTGLGITLERR